MQILLLVLVLGLNGCQFLASPEAVAIEEEVAEEAIQFIEFELSQPSPQTNIAK